MIVHDTLFIDGSWRPSTGQTRIAVTNAATGATIGNIPAATQADVDAAVSAAAAAFDSWSATPLAERTALLRRIADGLEARRAEIAATICDELGMPIKQCRDIQMGMPIALLRTTADAADVFAFESRIGNSTVIREPVGVVACIAPWNYPLHQIVAKVAPALAAGCTVVIKPSEVTPLNAFLFAQVCADAGTPAGVVNLVTGTGPDTGEALVRHRLVDMISFTGSTRAGRRVAELAAQDIKRVALELGGKSASIVLDDANLEQAVKATLAGCFLNSGQTCAATTRLLVPEGSYATVKALAADAIKRWTVGDPTDEATRLGPLVSSIQRERVQQHIDRALADGAELVAGQLPAADGATAVAPMVFGRVGPDSALAQEEVFGPVLAILTYADEDEAVRLANNSRYGLAGAVWSADPGRAERVARKIRTGQVSINGGAFNIAAPFGGYKQSGFGRENGAFGLEEYLETKALQH